MAKLTEREREIAANPVGALCEHLSASGAVGTFEDRVAYSLDRCGLVLVTERRLAELARTQNTPDSEKEIDRGN